MTFFQSANDSALNPAMIKKFKKFGDDTENSVINRPCLKCGKNFSSSWNGERICKRCKDTDAWRSANSSLDA
jgi:hypothetical protein